jgi:diguanylate cyclase (GGDEF)-like protein
MMERLLTNWGFEVVSAAGGREAWRILDAPDAPRLVVLDCIMPEPGGFELCRRIRQRTDAPSTYVLLLTSRDHKDDVLERLDTGADDFVLKPFHPLEFRARVNVGRRILELQSALLAAKESLETHATRDPLTGVWNRAAILDMCQRELERGVRQRAPVGLMMVDLDHFKMVNDTYGHLAGDAVLREAARRMQQVLRLYDAVGRYGGEEFLVIIPGCPIDVAVKVAERIRGRVAQLPVQTTEGTIVLTCSLGVTVSQPEKPTEINDLIRAADAALYRAKNSGRNRVELADGIH